MGDAQTAGPGVESMWEVVGSTPTWYFAPPATEGALVYIQLHGGWLPSTWLPLSESVVKEPHLQEQQPSC